MIKEYAVELLKLWLALPFEFRALIIFLVCIISLTKSAEKVIFTRKTPAKKERYAKTVSLVVSLAGSAAGPFLSPEHVKPWFWVFTACSGAPVSWFVVWVFRKVVMAFLRWRYPGITDPVPSKPSPKNSP